MPYQPDTVAAVVNRLNVQHFLPAIQREFVWQPFQIIQLFDSLLRGYPISSFLFWELKPENRDRWEIYKFIDQFSQLTPHNPPAHGNGVQQLTLVLDGQQRLTSLLIGLKGSYTFKRKYKRWDNPSAWVKQRLYLDLLQDPKNGDENAEIGVRYGFLFAEKQPKSGDGHYWFPVGRILDFDSDDKFSEFVGAEEDNLPDSTTRVQARVFRNNLDRLHRAIWKDAVISYYTEHDQDYDRVLDIFVRANEGGTKLSKSDLLLSMVTLKWEGMNAREEIYGLVERLNNDLTRKNNFDKDFIMKTCLVLSDLNVAYLVENFNNANLDTIRQRWPAIKTAIEAGVDLVNSFGIDRDTLTSANALIPILYYLYQHPHTNLRGSTPFDTRNAAKIRRWLTTSLLNNVFSGTSDTALRDARRALQENAADPNADFPAEKIDTDLARTGRVSYTDDYAVENYLAITYGRQLTFLALSLLYDGNHWGTMQVHQDHIFPQSLFTAASMNAAGIASDQQVRYLEMVNRIGNLELLLSHENEEKSNKDFSTWLATRDQGFKKRHLIPDDLDLLRFERFEEFIAEREKLIRQRLDTLFDFDTAIPLVAA